MGSRSIAQVASQRSTWGLVLRLGLLLVMLSQLTGCTVVTGINNYLAYNTECDDFVVGWRDHVYSRRAYNMREPNLPTGRFPSSFREGFIAGYHNVAGGGNGCPPTMPPRKFWGWKYQTAEGQCKVNAWFEGFPYGAQAAEEDGIGNYREIQISGQLEDMLRAEGKLGKDCYNCGPGYGPDSELQYPDGEIIDPGIEVPETPLPDSPLSLPTQPTEFDVKPASYVLQRLPPTRPNPGTIAND